MKLLTLSLLVVAAVIANTSLSNVDEDTLVNEINTKQDLWKAGKNHISSEVNAMKHMLGLRKTITPTIQALLTQHDYQMPKGGIPKAFDARQKWPDCPIDAIQDQSNCGSSWAISSAKVMSDRLCIASKYTIKVNISAQELTSCCKKCGNGCIGGDTYMAWEYFIKHGLVTGGDYESQEGCQPYLIKPCSNDPSEGLPPCPPHIAKTPACHRICYNHSYKVRYAKDVHHGRSVYFVTNVTAMQIEIMTNGPVVAVFTVYSDFLQYQSGIYKQVSGDAIAGYAVRVIGWGVEKKVPYWLAAIPWRRHFGENGYFRIVLGKNECDFESYVVAGLVKPK